MEKDLKLRQHLNIINAKLDFLIHAQSKTAIVKDALGQNKMIHVSGEEQFIKWVENHKNIKSIPQESNQKQDDKKS